MSAADALASALERWNAAHVIERDAHADMLGLLVQIGAVPAPV